MSYKLYVRRGGGATGTATDYMDRVAMAVVRKGAPVFDAQLPLIQMGRRAADGEASQGYFKLVDPEAEIHSTTYRLSPHALVTWTTDASGDELWLARGRIAPLESGRRASYIPGTDVEWDVTVNDNNMDLRGQAFSEPWVRPSETDLARILALRNYTLNGSSSTATHHRNSCNPVIDHDVNGHLVSTAFSRVMPARTYPAGTQPQEVIAECAERSGKTYAIVIHHTGGDSHDCLLYIGALDHATYASNVKISDQIADWDLDSSTAPVFPPVFDQGKGMLTENDDVVSGVVVIYAGTNGNPQSVFVHDPADETPYEYWVEAINDDKVDTVDEAQNLAEQYFTSHRAPGHRSYRFSVKMLTSQHHLLAAGMSIQVKGAVLAGGLDLGNYVWRRITELRWEPDPDPDYIWARINLEKPLRRRGLGLQPTATTPTPPNPGTPGTPPTAPTEDARWSFTDRGGAAYDNLFADSTSTYRFDGGGWNRSSVGVGLYFGSDAMYFGYSGAKTLAAPVPVTAGVDYTFGFRGMQQQTYSNARFYIEWRNSTTGTLLTETLQSGFPYHVPTSYTFVRTAPVGATHVRLGFITNSGSQGSVDDVYIAHGGSGGTPGTPSTSPTTTVGGTGSGVYTDSQEYVPPGSVLEHQYITEGGPYHDADQIAIDDVGDYYVGDEVEAALQEIGASLASVTSPAGLTKTGGEKHTVSTVTDAGSALTLDLAEGNVFEITLTDDCTISATGFTNGEWCEGSVIAHQDGTGGWTLSYDSPFVLPDAGTTLPNDPDSTSGFGFGSLDGGTTIYWWAQNATSSLTVSDEGTPLATDATSLDFVGSGVVASGTGAAKTVTISGAPTGAAGGDLSGTYPNPSVVDDSHSHTSATAPGSAGSGIGPILISDTPSTPLVFADLIQNEAQDDLVYADV